MAKFTIKQFNAKYTSDDVCLHEIFMNRYGGFKKCPKCKEATKFHKVTDRKCYACQYCGHQLHPLAGTIFHKSDTSLKLWFYAIFLFASSKNGVSAKELERQLGVTYKTAWRMAKQIRLLFQQSKRPMGGPVEVDETYVGKKNTMGGFRSGGKRGRGAPGKTPVVGIVQRDGKVRAFVTPNVQKATVIPLIMDNVKQASVVYTDEFLTYNVLEQCGYFHEKVAHGKKEYARGLVHVNTLEGFWGQLKRSINGTYHYVSPKYLQQYVNEFAYRYNLRHYDVDASFSSMISEVSKQVL